MAGNGGAAALPPLNLANLTEKELSCLLVAPPPGLLINCGGLLIPHSRGVCCFVAQLVQLKRRGTKVWLCNVHPGLRYCLHLLELEVLFHLTAKRC